MNIICIIPAWNEEKNIFSVVSGVKKNVDKVIVVDDGSQDKTAQKAQEAGAEVIRHIANRGQGAALQTGNELALARGADILIHFDADGQFLSQEIPEIIKPLLQQKAEIVFGSRFLEKKSKLPFSKKYFLIPLAHLVNRLVLGVNLSDPQSGFRALSAKAAKTIKIEQDGMAHCSEIIYKTFKYKLELKEIPITVIYHDFGQKLGGGIKILKDLLLAKLMD